MGTELGRNFEWVGPYFLPLARLYVGVWLWKNAEAISSQLAARDEKRRTRTNGNENTDQPKKLPEDLLQRPGLWTNRGGRPYCPPQR